jgi:hypothetical protein
MSAFARASATLFANTDMAEDVTFIPAGPGVQGTARAVFQEPTADVALYGQTMRMASLAAWLPVSLTPVKGDTIVRGETTYVINAAPELDSQGTAWRCPLDPVGAP